LALLGFAGFTAGLPAKALENTLLFIFTSASAGDNKDI